MTDHNYSTSSSTNSSVHIIYQIDVDLTAKYIQASKTDNVVFGLVRDKGTATKLLELASGSSNIHVLQADITDVPALKVRSLSTGSPFLACS